MQRRAAFAHAEWCWRMWSVGSAVAAAQLRSLWHHDPDAFTERVSLRSVAKQHGLELLIQSFVVVPFADDLCVAMTLHCDADISA